MKLTTEKQMPTTIDTSRFFLEKTPGPTCQFFQQGGSQSKLKRAWSAVLRFFYHMTMLFPVVAYVGSMLLLLLYWDSDYLHFSCAKINALTLHMITWGGIVGTVRGINRFRQSKQTNWYGKFVQEFGTGTAYEKQAQTLWSTVRHVIIIPNYNEDLSVLTEVLRNLSQCEMAQNMIVVLAMEEKEKASRSKASFLEGMYAAHFDDMISSFHPPQMEGELPGKSSNVSWAFREFRFRMAGEPGFSPENTTVTVMDADSFINKKFFSILTYKFLKTHERDATIWQAPVINYRNYYSVPIASRCTSMTVTMHEIGCLNNDLWLNFMFWKLPFSTYSLAYTLADAVGGWDSDVVAEDHHMYFKCNMYGPHGYCNVDTIHVPMVCESVVTVPQGEDLKPRVYASALYQRYQQAVRHTLGFGEIAYVVGGGLSGLLSPGRCLIFIYKLLHMHYFVAMPAVVMMILQVRAQGNLMDIVTGDWVFGLLLGGLLPSSVVLLLVNQRLLNSLISEELIETPAKVHGAGSMWASPKVQMVYEFLTFSALSPLISVMLHYVPAMVASIQLTNMQSFVYVVAARGVAGSPAAASPVEDSEDCIAIELPGDGFDTDKSDARKGMRFNSSLKSLV